MHEPGEQPGVCIACGARETPLVLTCEFQSAGRQENDLWNDPHVVHSNATPRKALKAPDLRAAGKFKMDRPWTDLLAHIAETPRFGPGGKPISLLVVGFATGRALNIDVWERTIPPPATESIKATPACLIRQWQKQSSGLIRKVRPRDQKGSCRKHVEIRSTLAAIRPHVERRVSARAGELLAGGDAPRRGERLQ